MDKRRLKAGRSGRGVLLAWLVWALWLLGLPLVLLTLALVLGVVFVQDYKDRIAGVATELLGRDVRIERIRIVPRAPLGVALVLSGVEVQSEDPAGSFSLRDLYLDVDLPATVAAQALVPGAVRIVGLNGMISRDAEGVLRVVGFIPGGGRLRPDLILADGEVEILDSVLSWRGPDTVVWPFRIDTLTLSGQDAQRVVEAELALPANRGGEVRAELRWPQPPASAPSTPPDRVEWRLSAETFPLRLDATGSEGGPGLQLAGLSASGEIVSPALPWPVPDPLPGSGSSLSGTIDLTAEALRVDFDAVFEEPQTADDLRARLVWRRDAAGWQVALPELQLDHPLGELEGRLRLDGPADPGQTAQLDLDLRLTGRDGNLAGLRRVLPVGVMGPRLRRWLSEAFSTGSLTTAGLRWQGPLPGSSPVESGRRADLSFQARFEDARLDYRPGWPALEAVTAGLSVNNTGLVIDATGGRMAGVELGAVRVDLDAFSEGLLEVDGVFSGDGDSLLGLLQALPPIPEPVVRTIRGFRLGGRHPGQLSLRLPLRGGVPTFAGHVDLDSADLDWVDQRLEFTGVDGRVTFTEAGIRSEGLVFQSFGGRGRVVIDHTPPGADSRIRLEGRVDQVDMERVRDRLPALDFLSGSSHVAFDLTVPGFRAELEPPVLRVRTDLLGTTIALPEPADKGADQAEPLALSMRFGQVPGPLRFDLGERLSGVLAWNGQRQLDRLGVGLGQAAPEPLVPGVVVRGRADALDVSGWIRRSTGAPAVLALRELDLVVEQFRLGDRSLGEVELRADGGDGAMLFLLEGAAVSGTVDWDRERAVPLRVLFRRFFWPTVALSAQAAPEPAAGTIRNPGQWPAVSLRIDSLMVGRWPLGALELEAGPDPDAGYRSHFGLTAEHGRLDGTGDWQAGAEGGINRYALELRSGNAGALLAELGMPGLVSGGRVESKAELVWPGHPGPPPLDRLAGQVWLSLDELRLQPVDPGAGRLLGLISISSIPRRLFLDFSDVLRPGFLVDRLRANIDIGEGVARSDDFWMQGASARIELDGSADLVQRTLDLAVAVLPKTSAAMPLVGGLLGGPPGAAALFLMEQLIREQVDRATRMRYRIDGPWSEPRIERVARDATAESP